MSSALAIAATATVVARIIDDRVAAEGLAAFQNQKTSMLSPEQIEGGGQANVAPQLNLFTYHVGMNAAWRSRFEPSRDPTGMSISSPHLALDISLLLSAHSSTSLHPEMLLGLAMQGLHDNPQLTRQRVRDLLHAPAGGNDPLLTAIERSRLADQFEIIRVMPLNLPPGDMQQLWTALHSRYRPSFCYQISAILIDSVSATKSALPVQEVTSVTIPFLRPYIDRIEPPSLPFDPNGNEIALYGHDLVQPELQARFDSGETQPLEPTSTKDRAVLKIPGTLRAGVMGVRLVRSVTIGAPPAKEAVSSNVIAFVHRPIFAAPPADPGAVQNLPAPPHRVLSIRLHPPVQPRQDVQVVLNEVVAAGNASLGFTFPGEVGANPAADPVTFRLVGVPNGTYFVRVRVDGAETPLTRDAAGRFTGPTITLA